MIRVQNYIRCMDFLSVSLLGDENFLFGKKWERKYSYFITDFPNCW